MEIEASHANPHQTQVPLSTSPLEKAHFALESDCLHEAFTVVQIMLITLEITAVVVVYTPTAKIPHFTRTLPT